MIISESILVSNMLKRLVATVVLALGVISFSPAAGNLHTAVDGTGGVKVISSTPGSVTLEYSPVVTKTGTVLIDGVAFTKFSIPDNNSGVGLRPGMPATPEKIESLLAEINFPVEK